MHREVDRILGRWLMAMVLRGFIAVVAAVVISDIVFDDSPGGRLLVAATSLAAIAIVAFRIANRAQGVAEQHDEIRRTALDRTITAVDDGWLQSELRCQKLLISHAESPMVPLEDVMEFVLKHHPDCDVRHHIDDVEVSEGIGEVIVRLIWDAKESRGRRIIVGTRDLGTKLAIVVVDDGAHRQIPGSLEGLSRIGFTRLARHYEGGLVASSVEFDFESRVETVAHQVSRPALGRGGENRHLGGGAGRR